jgi:hypothetical protein
VACSGGRWRRSTVAIISARKQSFKSTSDAAMRTARRRASLRPMAGGSAARGRERAQLCAKI